jgi:hypothetical protein
MGDGFGRSVRKADGNAAVSKKVGQQASVDVKSLSEGESLGRKSIPVWSAGEDFYSREVVQGGDRIRVWIGAEYNQGGGERLAGLTVATRTPQCVTSDRFGARRCPSLSLSRVQAAGSVKGFRRRRRQSTRPGRLVPTTRQRPRPHRRRSQPR